MVSVRQAEVIRSGKHLFKNFSFEFNRGEHWMVSGKNGSGKTTLLELIAGIVHPAQGIVNYDFILADSWDERFLQRKEKIHYVPAHAIQSFLQGHEMFYQQRYYSIGDERTPLIKDIFGEDLARLQQFSFPQSFDIRRLLNLPLTRLSNGQLKKVIILKNLVRQLPELLLLDYPFEGLDSRSRDEFTAFLDHLAEAYNIHLMIADHHHHLPACINRKIELDNFRMVHQGNFRTQESVIEYTTPTVESTAVKGSLPVMEMENVTIRYGESVIIKDLNWSVRQGERWALLGRNGSGKTTLFSMIFADHPMAYSEKVYLFGKRRGSGESIWDIKKRINYLGPELINFLNPKAIPVTAKEYILSQHQESVDAQLEQLIEFFRVEKFLHMPVKHLSSGELQLMLLLNYFLSRKELLLLDEPFQFLDPFTRDKVTEYLQYYLSKEITLILITHYEKDVTQWTQQSLRL